VSHLTNLIEQVGILYADPSVSFKGGSLELNRHAQQRRITFVRKDGVLRFSSGPQRVPKTIPILGVGGQERIRFVREERYEVTVRGENEDVIDVMLDRLVNVIFELLGPNALLDENPYHWVGGDSTNAANNTARNPELVFDLAVRVQSRTQTVPYLVLEGVDATAILGATSVTLTPIP
jgi:hypothetical protein